GSHARTRSAHGIRLTAQDDCFRINAPGSDGCGWRDQNVDVLEHAGVFLLDQTLDFQSFRIIPSQYELPRQGAIEYRGSVVVSVRLQIRLMRHHTVRHPGDAQGTSVLHAGECHLSRLDPEGC